MIDQRTINRNYLVPHPDNMLDEDVTRIKDSFEKIDIDVNDLYETTTQSIENAQSGAYWFGSSTGTGSAYEINLNPAPTALNMGMFIYMKAHAKNSGSATVKINTLDPKNVKKIDGSDLKQGDIPENGIVTLVYDGTNFQLVSSAMDKEQTGVNTSNIMRAFEEIQENHGGSLLMEAGWSDSFSNPNEQGADEASSSGYKHDPSNMLYKGSESGTSLNSDKNYDTESDYLQQEWTNANQSTGQVDFSDTSVGVPTLDQSNTTISANEPVNNNSGGLYRAMTFTAGVTGDLSKISLNLIKNGNPDAGATFTAEIRSTGGGQPTTTVLSSTEAISVGSISSSAAWYDFTFSSKPSLTSGVKYAIVVTASYVAGGNAIGWSNDNNTNTYANGSGYHGSDGISWFSFSNYDYAFKTYVDSVFVTEKRAKLSSGTFPTNCENARISFDNGTSWFDIENRDSDTQLALVGDLTKGQTYSASTSGSASENESKPFDDNSGTYWNPTNSNSLPQWLKVEYSSATVINKINLNWYDTATYTYTFEGSNDDASYDTLLTITAKSYTANTLTSETFVNTTAYKCYRINITAKTGGSYVIIREMEMLHIPTDGTYDYIIRLSELNSGKVKLNAAGSPNGLDENTILLVHMDGIDGSTTFTDSSQYGHTLTPSNVEVDTAQSQFGVASMIDSGSSPNIEVTHSTIFDFGSGDFTIDFWVRFATLKDTTFYQYHTTGSNYSRFQYYHTNTRLQVDDTTLGHAFANTWNPSVNTWYHIAFVRSGASWYTFVNGSQVGSTSIEAGILAPRTEVFIGDPSYGKDLDGWLDEFRISNIARWTSNFTPPNSAYSGAPNPALEYVSVCDSESHKTSVSGWLDINSGSATEKLNSQNAYYWLGFDPAPNFGPGTEINICKNIDSEVAGNSSSYVPDQNDAHNRTLVDLFYSVGNNQTVTQIGIKVECVSPVDLTIMIFNEDSITQYDVLYSEAGFTHTGGGELEWFTLSTPFVTPASGTIRIGYHNGTAGTLKYYQNDPATMVYRTGSAPTGNDVTFSNGGGQIATSYKHHGATPSVWRKIAKNDGIWKYNNDATDTAAEDWVPSTIDDMLHAVSQAISSQSSNRMTRDNLASITDTEWEGTGGWSTSVDSIVRGVTLYSNSSTQSPSVSQYRLNYDSERGAMDLRSKAYDPGFEPSEGYVWSRIEHTDSDGPGTFYVSRNGGAEWTVAPMAQQGLPISGDVRIYRGTVDINGQTSGQDLRCRYETEQGKDQFLHSWGLQVKS